MLTSCLHTERAITSSIRIMEAFVEITHILRHNRLLASSAEIARLEDKTNLLNTRIESIEKNMVTKDDISDLIKLFDTGVESEEILCEYPNMNITLLKSLKRVHDRYIVLDHGTVDMKVYHSGASVKDAGNKITTITRITDISEYKATVRSLISNPALILK